MLMRALKASEDASSQRLAGREGSAYFLAAQQVGCSPRLLAYVRLSIKDHWTYRSTVV